MSTDENDTAEDSSASPRTQSVDVVVVGAGTSGCYAAATIANAGYDVTIVERKPEEEAGHIACGDALKGADAFPEAIPKSKIEPAFTNTEVDHGRFEIPQEDTVLDIPVPGELAVIDRWEYGRLIIEGAEEAGAELHYDTVVQDVKQDDDGTVTGIVGKHDGEVVEYDADIVIDGAGSLSLLQDKVDFSGTTFDTNVSYQHFSSAYREVVEVPEPVEWSDALVFKPAEVAAGYVWYFPRTETEINAGLGFQMTEEPMKLVDDLKRDLRERPETYTGTAVTYAGRVEETMERDEVRLALVAVEDDRGRLSGDVVARWPTGRFFDDDIGFRLLADERVRFWGVVAGEGSISGGVQYPRIDVSVLEKS